ncbi:MAG: MBL fold metallo-hydrolase [Candidatus Symbiothrix sp.]|jgi:glyoxylase-like metal-dependent hydrolase (beta-lactamase superfamily II)|nr:MBL fold metallo-hydrolase [Candidatus Symbiothrix sp.]
MQYKLLKTGYFYADGGAMFGAIPKRAWMRKYPSEADNCCRLAMNCLLAWNERRVVVLDTGVGIRELGKLSYYRFHDTQDIAMLVQAQGFEPDEVSDVVLSHLHFDHCGGCTYRDASGALCPTFPKARHWVSVQQWHNYLHPHPLERDSYRADDMLPVADAGLLHLIDATTAIDDDLRLELYDGHTAGQIVSHIKTDNISLVFAGDVIPTRAHVSNEWISAYDTHPTAAYDAKKRLKAQLSSSAQLCFYHDAFNV